MSINTKNKIRIIEKNKHQNSKHAATFDHSQIKFILAIIILDIKIQ